MRTTFRRHPREEEEESVFVSMTDMTVSFLFIVMILLAFFASQFNPEKTVPKVQYDRVTTELEQTKTDLRAKVADLATAQATIDELRKELEARIAEIASLGAKVGALQEQINTLQNKLTSSSAVLEELTDQLHATNKELTAATAAVEALKKQLAARDAAISADKLEINRLQQRIAELEAKLVVKDPLETYIAEAAGQRRSILETLRNELKIDFPSLDVVISEESDALRFQGDGLFQSGRSDLLAGPKKIVETIATRLEEILPCYTLRPHSGFSGDCNSGLSIIEAVQIEGHTDSTGDAIANLKLSTDRANATFVAMTAKEPQLLNHQNYRGQPVLSVAGYGEMRPIRPNDTILGRATNRRIDLRIIMYTPSQSEEIDKIRKALDSGLPGEAP